MERFAVISDLHANRYALDAFLQHIKENEPVSWVLNLGDFVQIGPHPAEVAETVLSDPRFLNIAGNNELALLERQPSLFGREEAAHQDWTIDRLGTDLLGRIGGLPRKRTLRLAGRRLLLLHAPPQGLTRQPLRAWPAGLATAQRGPAVDGLFYGHTHRLACLRAGGRLILNPGSLGCSPDGRGTFCLVEVSQDRLEVAVREVAYDLASLRSDYLQLDVPDREALLRRLHGISL